MVVLIHNSKISRRPKLPSHSARKKVPEQRNENNKNLFNLVAFLVLIAFLMKFLIEFQIQEKLKQRPKFPKAIIQLEEQHEIIEVFLNKSDKNSTNLFVHEFIDELFHVEIIDLPSENNLLNISNFKWIRNNASLCRGNVNSTTKLLPVLIHTSRNHFVERQVIRETWASMKNYKNWSVRPVFLIGEGNPDQPDEKEERALDKEHRDFGDVITGGFIDSYRNLTYKHMMGYKWIINYCMNAAYVIKADDDIFVDVLYFIDRRINETLDNAQMIFQKRSVDMHCDVLKDTPPSRDREDKWFVPEEEWPDQEYPDYCNGWCYGITVDWINRMYLMSSMTKFFWIDDAFTGILIDMASSFFKEEPEMEIITDLNTWENKVYTDLCKNSSGLANAERTFGRVAAIERNDDFESLMKCLWRKTLLDKKMLI